MSFGLPLKAMPAVTVRDTRYALSLTAHHRVTGQIVLAEFRAAVAAHGVPASTLTDNGMVFTTRFSGGKGRTGAR